MQEVAQHKVAKNISDMLGRLSSRRNLTVKSGPQRDYRWVNELAWPHRRVKAI